jgi:hypothetical protein
MCNFDVQRNNFSMINNTWWWPYVAETCSEEEGWIENTVVYLPHAELLKRRNLETRLRNNRERCFPLPSPRFPRFASLRTARC